MTGSRLWAGVDVGKEHHWICVLDASGTVVLSRRCDNDEATIRAVIRCDPASRVYYQRKRTEGKRPVQATICLARWRVDVLYALLRDNRTWQPTVPVTAVAA